MNEPAVLIFASMPRPDTSISAYSPDRTSFMLYSSHPFWSHLVYFFRSESTRLVARGTCLMHPAPGRQAYASWTSHVSSFAYAAQGMSVAATKNVTSNRRTPSLRDCHSSFSLVSSSAYPLVGPRLYPGGLGVVVSELDAGGPIGHFFATFFLAATRLALASAFWSAASFASRSTFNRAVFARVACAASRYSVMATLPSSAAWSNYRPVPLQRPRCYRPDLDHGLQGQAYRCAGGG